MKKITKILMSTMLVVAIAFAFAPLAQLDKASAAALDGVLPGINTEAAADPAVYVFNVSSSVPTVGGGITAIDGPWMVETGIADIGLGLKRGEDGNSSITIKPDNFDAEHGIIKVEVLLSINIFNPENDSLAAYAYQWGNDIGWKEQLEISNEGSTWGTVADEYDDWSVECLGRYHSVYELLRITKTLTASDLTGLGKAKYIKFSFISGGDALYARVLHRIVAYSDMINEPVTGVSISGAAYTGIGRDVQLTATHAPSGVSASDAWEIVGAPAGAGATVNASGVFRATVPGEYEVKVTASGAGSSSATATHTITAYGLELKSDGQDSVSVNREDVVPLSVTVDPAGLDTTLGGALGLNYEVLSGGPAYTLDSVAGTFTPHAAGTYTIRATSAHNAVSNTVTVTVSNTPGTPIAVTGITLTPTSPVSISVGDVMLIKSVVEPITASNKAINWVVTKNGTATADASVSVDGIFQAGAGGKYIVVAKATDGSDAESSPLTVYVDYTPATAVTLEVDDNAITVLESANLSVVFTPTSATNKNFEYIVTRDSNSVTTGFSIVSGKFSASVPGVYDIKVQAPGEGLESNTVTITVSAIPVSTVTLSTDRTTIALINSATLSVGIEPGNATYKDYTFIVKHGGDVVSTGFNITSEGVFTATEIGVYTIKVNATTDNVDSNEIIITVTATVEISSITVSANKASISTAESAVFTVEILPADASDKGYNYIVKRDNILATEGFTFVGDTFSASVPGVYKVSVKSNAHNVTSNEVTLTVTRINVTGISLITNKTAMVTSESATLTVGVNPANATDTTYRYSVKRGDVVVAEGFDITSNVFTATVAGVYKITAISTCGDKVSNEITITVKVAVTSVTLQTSEISLLVGAGATLTTDVLPNNATNQTITYTVKRDNAVVTTGFSIVDDVFTATVAGVYKITATADGVVSDEVTITVNAIEAVTDVELSADKSVVLVGGDVELTVVIVPLTATYQNYTYIVKRGNAVVTTGFTIFDDVFSATVAGEYKIIANATTDDVDSNEITVIVKIGVTDVELSADKSELLVGEEAELSVEVLPADATNKTVVYTVKRDDAVVTTGFSIVDDVFTATVAGVYKIMATADGIDSEEVTITVTEEDIPVDVPVTALVLTSSVESMSTLQFSELTVAVTPDNATDKAYIFIVKRDGVVVSSGYTINNGQFKATEAGVYTIIARSTTDGVDSNEVEIEVTSPVSGCKGCGSVSAANGAATIIICLLLAVLFIGIKQKRTAKCA